LLTIAVTIGSPAGNTQNLALRSVLPKDHILELLWITFPTYFTGLCAVDTWCSAVQLLDSPRLYPDAAVPDCTTHHRPSHYAPLLFAQTVTVRLCDMQTACLCGLRTVCCVLCTCTVYCVQCTVYCALCTVYCVQCTVHLYSVLCTVYCALVQFTVYCGLCTVYCVQCTVHFVQCTVYSVLCTCTVYCVQCTVYSVLCTVYGALCT
jgi:hypothetical protein